MLYLLSLRLIPFMFRTLVHTSSALHSAPVGLVLASALHTFALPSSALHSAPVGLVLASVLPSSSALPSSALHFYTGFDGEENRTN